MRIRLEQFLYPFRDIKDLKIVLKALNGDYKWDYLRDVLVLYGNIRVIKVTKVYEYNGNVMLEIQVDKGYFYS